MITIDNIDFKPVIRHGRVIPNYYVSQCGKVWNTKTKRYIKPYIQRRSKLEPQKCKEFSMTTEGQPYWDRGEMYKPKKHSNHLIEFRMKLHHAVINAWNPWYDYVNTLTREQLIKHAQECMCVDHKDDDPLNNDFDNLQYSTPMQNSNWRKKWGK